MDGLKRVMGGSLSNSRTIRTELDPRREGRISEVSSTIRPKDFIREAFGKPPSISERVREQITEFTNTLTSIEQDQGIQAMHDHLGVDLKEHFQDSITQLARDFEDSTTQLARDFAESLKAIESESYQNPRDIQKALDELTKLNGILKRSERVNKQIREFNEKLTSIEQDPDIQAALDHLNLKKRFQDSIRQLSRDFARSSLKAIESYRNPRESQGTEALDELTKFNSTLEEMYKDVKIAKSIWEHLASIKQHSSSFSKKAQEVITDNVSMVYKKIDSIYNELLGEHNTDRFVNDEESDEKNKEINDKKIKEIKKLCRARLETIVRLTETTRNHLENYSSSSKEPNITDWKKEYKTTMRPSPINVEVKPIIAYKEPQPTQPPNSPDYIEEPQPTQPPDSPDYVKDPKREEERIREILDKKTDDSYKRETGGKYQFDKVGEATDMLIRDYTSERMLFHSIGLRLMAGIYNNSDMHDTLFSLQSMIETHSRLYSGSERASLEANPNRQHSDLDTTPTGIESSLNTESKRLKSCMDIEAMLRSLLQSAQQSFKKNESILCDDIHIFLSDLNLYSNL